MYILGQKYSSDFDYDGMFDCATEITKETPIKDLEALQKSMTDVNYHFESNLVGEVIDSLKVNKIEEVEKNISILQEACR